MTGRCAGCDMSRGWDYFCLMPNNEDERCPNPGTCRYHDGMEWIPMCPEHYDLWCLDGEMRESGVGLLPLWEKYKP